MTPADVVQLVATLDRFEMIALVSAVVLMMTGGVVTAAAVRV